MPSPLRALAIWQPFASLLASGVQHTVTLKTAVHVTGPIAIYATLPPPGILHSLPVTRRAAITSALAVAGLNDPSDRPTGCVVGVACVDPGATIGRLVREMVEQAHGMRELLLGNYTDGRHLLPLSDARRISPVPCARPEQPGVFFDLPDDVARQTVDAASRLTGDAALTPALHRALQAIIAPPPAGLAEPPTVPGSTSGSPHAARNGTT